MIKVVKGNSTEGNDYLKSLKARAEEVQKEVVTVTNNILEDIRLTGDKGVIKYTNKFDSANIGENNLVVTPEEIEEAYKKVDEKFLEALRLAKKNIEEFHEKQKSNSWITTKEKGVIMGQTVRGLEKVGIYVPGGTAAYPSSVLMNGIPAKVAGVKEIYMVTPPSKDGTINPNILVAADMVGVKKIFKVGGAQAIGALAYGTRKIPKVDKIVGPGNIYVAIAKRSVYGLVDIDMIAGPSEILIIADENANPKFIAADLMSQAEHDILASSILVTTSETLALQVKEELYRQIESLERKDIIKTSLENYGAIILVQDLEEAISFANEIAPEHLEVLVKEPFTILSEIKNAGSIFLGAFSPEPLGDYMAGPNHVLPTSGTARFYSPLSVDDFIKKSSYLYYSKEALEEIKDKIVTLADTEGLTAHGNSIKVRFNND